MPTLTSAENKIIRTAFSLWFDTDIVSFPSHELKKINSNILSANGKLLRGQYNFTPAELRSIEYSLINFLGMLNEPPADADLNDIRRNGAMYKSLAFSAAFKLSIDLD